MTTVLAPERSDDELHDGIGARHREMCAAHRALLVDIAEHDRVEAWRRFATKSEEDYLVRFLSVAWHTAKDGVREARGLERIPELADGFEDGEMSADQLNSLCRLAASRTPDVEIPRGPFDSAGGPSDGECDGDTRTGRAARANRDRDRATAATPRRAPSGRHRSPRLW